jgi:hypothetical protein
MIELKGGVYLSTREEIIADQLTWDDEDESKGLDFTTCPFWITTDNGNSCTGIDTLHDLIEALS